MLTEESCARFTRPLAVRVFVMYAGMTIHLNPIDRERLRAIGHSRNSSQKHIWRARIVLGTAEGLGTTRIDRRS